MKTIDAYALLWSKRDNSFHVEPLTETVAKGRRFFLQNIANDYLVIGLGTYEETTQAAEALRPHMRARDNVSYLREVA